MKQQNSSKLLNIKKQLKTEMKQYLKEELKTLVKLNYTEEINQIKIDIKNTVFREFQKEQEDLFQSLKQELNTKIEEINAEIKSVQINQSNNALNINDKTIKSQKINKENNSPLSQPDTDQVYELTRVVVEEFERKLKEEPEINVEEALKSFKSEFLNQIERIQEESTAQKQQESERKDDYNSPFSIRKTSISNHEIDENFKHSQQSIDDILKSHQKEYIMQFKEIQDEQKYQESKVIKALNEIGISTEGLLEYSNTVNKKLNFKESEDEEELEEDLSNQADFFQQMKPIQEQANIQEEQQTIKKAKEIKEKDQLQKEKVNEVNFHKNQKLKTNKKNSKKKRKKKKKHKNSNKKNQNFYIVHKRYKSSMGVGTNKSPLVRQLQDFQAEQQKQEENILNQLQEIESLNSVEADQLLEQKSCADKYNFLSNIKKIQEDQKSKLGNSSNTPRITHLNLLKYSPAEDTKIFPNTSRINRHENITPKKDKQTNQSVNPNQNTFFKKIKNMEKQEQYKEDNMMNKFNQIESITSSQEDKFLKKIQLTDKNKYLKQIFKFQEEQKLPQDLSNFESESQDPDQKLTQQQVNFSQQFDLFYLEEIVINLKSDLEQVMIDQLFAKQQMQKILKNEKQNQTKILKDTKLREMQEKQRQQRSQKIKQLRKIQVKEMQQKLKQDKLSIEKSERVMIQILEEYNLISEKETRQRYQKDELKTKEKNKQRKEKKGNIIQSQKDHKQSK